MLYCTSRIARELTLELSPANKGIDKKLPLGNWFVDLFWCERRKCVLFMSDTTYLSFVVLDVFRSEMRPLASFFLHHLEQYLKAQGIPSPVRREVLDEYRYLKSASLGQDSSFESELETMQDLIFHARFLISHADRGVRDVDNLDISRQLSDVPITSLEMLFPWRAARVALGLESSETAQNSVLSQHPLARRVGSPSLCVINGGIASA